MHGLGQDAGQGEQDYQKAAYWFGEAARQGDGFAQLNLGFLYERGWGVNRNFEQARRLYRETAANSNPEIAKLGEEYLSITADASDAAPERATVSSTDKSSDFWATVVVAGLVVGRSHDERGCVAHSRNPFSSRLDGGNVNCQFSGLLL